MSTSSELQREREVQGHLQSWHAAQGSPRNVALNVDNIPRLATGGGYKPQASPDKALSAFAQLAVLRLDMKRSMVSLIDATTETILSEATQNLLIGDLCAAAKASGSSNMAGKRCNNTINDLWLGSSSTLLRSEGICGNALESTCIARDPDGSTYTAAGLIVSDCRLDPRFASRPYVIDDHGIRFYAGVPIISRRGHRIGVYAVTDEKPRAGLTIDELQFMQSVAQAVMDHLEWARDRVDHFKGQRIVRGLAAFIEGSSSVGVEANWVKDGAMKPTTLRPPLMTVARSRRTLSHQNHLAESESPSDAPARSRSPQAPLVSLAKKEKLPKANSLSRLFRRAAEVLRDSTLADGVVLFGATASNARPVSHDSKSGGYQSSDEDEHSAHATSGSEGVGMDSSDSDASPTSRPCKVLAYSLLDESVHANIEDGPALSVGTLDKYFTLFPKGKGFSFCDEGRGISSEDDSASDRDAVGHAQGADGGKSEGRPRPKVKMDHHELLKKIPGARAVIFVPLFDYVEDRLAGGCFLWSSVPGRMINLDADLSYLRAFGNSIMSQVARINSQKNDAAKTTFIASMSHELRSPLHGILGAAEFLKDTHTDSYQTDLINSIFTCGRTLLETLNHVLDYSKINHLGHPHRRRGGKHHRLSTMGSNSDSLNMTAVVDMGTLVEEVVDAVAAGHTFKNLTREYSDGTLKIKNGESPGLTSAGNAQDAVTVVLDICPKTSWMVRTQPGALRRIIMNLFGNSLKYTTSGSVLVSLRGQVREDGSKIDALIKVVDTGKGMSEEFQQNRLFLPFSQEDSFQPGTGLGLSIVKQIVKSLGGSLDLKSQQGKGTEVTVRLPLVLARGEALLQRDEAVKSMAEKTKGLRLGLLGGEEGPGSAAQSPEVRMRNEVLAETCSHWFQMDVVKEGDVAESEPDIYLYCEPPPVQSLEKQLLNTKRTPKRKNIPMIIVCPSAEEAATVSQHHLKPLAKFSQIIEVIPQPCGPRKLANAFKHCLERAQKMAEEGVKECEVVEVSPETEQKIEAGTVTDAKSGPTCVITVVNEDQSEEHKQAVTVLPPPQPAELQTTEPQPNTILETRPKPALKEPKQAVNGNITRVLLVDDNAINLKLLVVFMKKCGFTYEEAENGQIAVDKFKEACADYRRFDFILMDIGMPVMDGIEATKQIREHERENSLPLTNVIALTGLASADARRDVMSAGVDVYLPKPVRFAELKKMLTAR